MALKTNHEIQRRANAHADRVMEGELARMPLAKALVAKLHPDYQRARTHLARTFVIGYAAGVEDSTTPTRTVKP
jgi:hypothetical protein